jgi:NADPH:quinone reductase-like Zn-dependent oxidoreductase
MKAAVIHQYGGPSELKFEDVPDPVVHDSDVLLKVRATSVNPIDVKMRSGAVKDRFPLTFPAILGVDVSGVIVAVGRGVTSFSIGDRVFAQTRNAYATLCAVKADALARLPEGMELADAAALPTVTTTGAQLANLALGSKGATVLVLGALGNVGRSAVYVLKEHSATVIAGVATGRIADVTQIGADGAVAVDDQGDIDRLPLLDAIADTVDGPTAAAVLRKLKPGGVFASVLGPPSNASTRADVVIRSMTVKSDPMVSTHMAHAVLKGGLSIPLGKSFPLKDAAAAHAEAERGRAGKILLLAE